MEEYVGQLWHKWVTRASNRQYPEHRVQLDDVRHTVGIMFRALGGEGGLQVTNATPEEHHAKRSLMERIAGTNQTIEYAWRDNETLRLPESIAVFPDRQLNQDLYLWLAALAAVERPYHRHWLARSCDQVAATLIRFPGLKRLYQRLVDQHLQQRPSPDLLKGEERETEMAIRAALSTPEQVKDLLNQELIEPFPVHVWLHPNPPNALQPVDMKDQPEASQEGKDGRSSKRKKKRKGERVDMPEGKDGLLAFRMESMFSWTEYIPVDRTTDEDEENDPESTADDLDTMSIARSDTPTASKVKFDLDLPPEANDDLPLGEGILLPEWDFKTQHLQPDYCCLQPMLARNHGQCELPEHLRGKAKRIRAQFEMLLPQRFWMSGQPDGTELDLNAYITHEADRLRGRDVADLGLYRNFRNTSRDMACLLLADLSLSTDSWVNNDARVIDVIRDSMFLFSEALSATGDRFSIYGFSSRRRNHVRFHHIKRMEEAYDGHVRGRIQAIQPGFYTRMGAAIRQASSHLAATNAEQRVLLILTDGKPNDLDKYEGRYGVEDTKAALQEARKLGLQPFCVTIDEQAEDYLPYIFGPKNYVVIRKVNELPKKLPLLYAQLSS